MTTAHKWNPITDLPDDWRRLADTELPPLARVWAEQRGTLASEGDIEQFSKRLRRQWAIETGIIERLYDIDRGVTQLLIEKGINASLVSHGDTDRPADEVIAIVRDQQETVEGLFDFVGNRRDLSTSYIKDLHQLLTRHQPTTSGRNGLGRNVQVELLRGEWKKWPNNPTREDDSIHEYCPPEQVASEMDRLITMHLRHVGEDVPPEVEAAWLHHQFTQIHPFQDGNGRVARCLATLVFLRAGWFPLVVTRDDRSAYIEALEQADGGELAGLVRLFVGIERKAMLGAIGLSSEAYAEALMPSDVIAAAQDTLLRRRRERDGVLKHPVFALVQPLEATAEARLKRTATDLDESLRRVHERYRADAKLEHDAWEASAFTDIVVQAGQVLGYSASTEVYHGWCELDITTDRHADVVVSFHALGPEFSGVIAASVVAMLWEDTPSAFRVQQWHVACSRAFQVNYLEEEAAVAARFETWLSESLVIALDQWRRWL